MISFKENLTLSLLPAEYLECRRILTANFEFCGLAPTFIPPWLEYWGRTSCPLTHEIDAIDMKLCGTILYDESKVIDLSYKSGLWTALCVCQNTNDGAVSINYASDSGLVIHFWRKGKIHLEFCARWKIRFCTSDDEIIWAEWLISRLEC